MTPSTPSANLPLTVHRAHGFLSRLGGLLARPALEPEEALYLAPCASVHTLFMAYGIDLVFLDRAGRVLKIVPDLRPWRLAVCWGAHAALELRAGEVARRRIERGALTGLVDPTAQASLRESVPHKALERRLPTPNTVTKSVPDKP